MYTLRYTPQSKLTSLEPKTMMTSGGMSSHKMFCCLKGACIQSRAACLVSM